MKEGEEACELTVYTVGHSNRGVEEFIALLKANGVDTLADIRKLPGSNKYPHFNQEELAASLAHVGIRYVYLKGFGREEEAEQGLKKYGVAEQVVPRVRRPHGDRRVPGGRGRLTRLR